MYLGCRLWGEGCIPVTTSSSNLLVVALNVLGSCTVERERESGREKVGEWERDRVCVGGREDLKH